MYLFYLTGALGVNMAEYVLSGKEYHPGMKRYVSVKIKSFSLVNLSIKIYCILPCIALIGV